MVVRIMATIVALLVVVIASFFLWNADKTIVSTHAPAVNVDGRGVQKAPAESPRRAGEDQLSTKRIKPKPDTIIGLIMMLTRPVTDRRHDLPSRTLRLLPGREESPARP